MKDMEVFMKTQIKINVNSEYSLENQYYAQEVRKHNDAIFNETRKRHKYHIVTYGCQMNEHDSEKMSAMLSNMGYEETDENIDADIIIFNTCAVRENAELRVFGNLGWVKTLKKKNPNLIVAVSGCMIQQAHIVEKIKKSYRFVDLVFGTHNVHNLPKLLKEVLEVKHQVIEVWNIAGNVIEGLPYERKIGMKAFVNIMFGCNNFCSYCIVPYTRGRERSRKKEHILEEIMLLAKDGVKEITLLGQNVNSYGMTFEEPYDFSDLLEDVSKVEGIERLRFMTSHPKDISDKLIQVIYKNPKVCEYVHLPIQSGSNKILKAMNRHYTREDYLESISKLKTLIPDIGLSTDIIIGFPGETEDDVQQTIDILEQVDYDSAFTFIYSKRSGTPAAEMEDPTEERTKHERFEKMLSKFNAQIIEKNSHRNGNIYQVLVEGYTKKGDGKLVGRSRENLLVTFSGDSTLIGKLVDVRITRPKSFSLEGEIINTSV
jgi:tRNA-2-methylthio-N6-dimethylallyladenosine synthase